MYIFNKNNKEFGSFMVYEKIKTYFKFEKLNNSYNP